MKLQHWTCEVDDDGLAWLNIDVKEKSVNVLTRDVVTELVEVADFLEKTNAIKAMALMSAKPLGFVYGADINEFETLATEEDVAALLDGVHATFARIASLPYPTVAGIDGYALGGGLELALLCDRLILTDSPKTQVGFPEVKLGLMPGYGGTGRAYGRVGAMMVLDMMLTGRMVSAGEALKTGLVDALAPERDALKATMQDVLSGLGGTKPERHAIEGEDTAAVIEEVKAKFLKGVRPDHTPAPYAITDHIANNAPDATAISAAEKDIFPTMMHSPASKGLRRNFQLSDMVRRSARGDSGISSLHVIGAGVMGGDIAAVAAMSGLAVTLSDMSAEAVDKALGRAQALYERRLKAPDKIKAAMDRLTADPKGEGVAKADLIIEAVAERLDVKKTVFADVEKKAKSTAVLATNTSAIPLEDIAAALSDPSRLIGLHFFNPMPVLPLVEVIASSHSDEDSIAKGMQFAGQMKKMPIRCKSVPGFVVNRALIPYVNAGLEMMLEGGDADKIDQALVEFGMPMGPVELADQIGLDVMHDASVPLGMPAIVETKLKEMAEAGTIGRKSGSGFYKWVDMKADRPRKTYDPAELSEIAEKLLAPMVRECRAAVDEGTVESMDHADAAMIFGVGFPAFRGGPLFYSAQKQN
jgi:3-hydroxyacyl-CoA dehydrogenase/enoyl-CoA hydratase/3-hydroxybutyryl-CoA epimerase